MPILLSAILLCLPAPLRAQDFSKEIRAAAEACLQATVRGDAATLARYTYPAVIDMLDNIAGEKGKAIQFIEQQMKSIEEEGARIDSGTVGQPSPHVIAGEELMAVIPTTIYMTIGDMSIRQESYMIAISGNSGTTWTFINRSDNIEMMISMLLPNWNPALQLPEKKEVEIISMGDDDLEENGEKGAKDGTEEDAD